MLEQSSTYRVGGFLAPLQITLVDTHLKEAEMHSEQLFQ